MSTCPGEIERLENPPQLDPIGREVGEETAYAQLDLSTPEEAALTASQLFSNRAFLLFFFSMDGWAQAQIGRAGSNLNLSTFVPDEAVDQWEGIRSTDQVDSGTHVFVQLMEVASDHGLHLLDLSGPFEVKGSTSLMWEEPSLESSESVSAQVVEVRDTETGDSLHVLMVESPSGRWRLSLIHI